MLLSDARDLPDTRELSGAYPSSLIEAGLVKRYGMTRSLLVYYSDYMFLPLNLSSRSAVANMLLSDARDLPATRELAGADPSPLIEASLVKAGQEIPIAIGTTKPPRHKVFFFVSWCLGLCRKQLGFTFKTPNYIRVISSISKSRF
jgi:hypothetical protein